MGSAEGPPSGHHASPPPPSLQIAKWREWVGPEREGERSWELMGLVEHQDHLLELSSLTGDPSRPDSQ